jgi:hypothetical protein
MKITKKRVPLSKFHFRIVEVSLTQEEYKKANDYCCVTAAGLNSPIRPVAIGGSDVIEVALNLSAPFKAFKENNENISVLEWEDFVNDEENPDVFATATVLLYTANSGDDL